MLPFLIALVGEAGAAVAAGATAVATGATAAVTAATTTTAGTLLATGAKAAAVYTAGKTAKTAYKYVTTDQEKEGRELGIKVAAKIYEPVFEDLKRQKDKIIAEEKKEHSDFESQAKLLNKQCEYYERETANYKRQIETIKREHGDSPGVKAALTTLAASGGATIGTGAMLGVNSVRAFGSTVASSGFSLLALPAAILTYFLESEMHEKRERFFQEEFEKKARVWLGKIESCKAEISERLKSLKFLKHNNTYRIKELKGIVDDALKEYSGARTDYNTLSVVKQK